MTSINLDILVNGSDHRTVVDVRTTLLDVLRDQLGLIATKRGCDRGECGACTVLVNNRPTLACLTLAVSIQGDRVTTAEAVAPEGSTLARLRESFVEHDALQCGFCTPGQIMAGVACINAGQANTDAAVQEWMSGNLCRCAAYPQIVAAVRAVAPVS